MTIEKPVYKIAYYSGTGGTAIVAGHFEEFLKKHGCSGITINISRDLNHEGSFEHDLLILVFPVHAFNAPEPVYRWIEAQIPVRQINAAVISVSGGGEVFPNKASRLSSIRRLEKKGYSVSYESMIVMPSNCMIPAKAPLPYLLIQILPEKVYRIVTDLLTGTFFRSRPPLTDRCLSLLGEMEKPAAKSFGRYIKVSDNCASCGWCSSACPSSNIEMTEGKPRFCNKCNMCLRCIYGCPQKALNPGIGKFMILKEGYDIQKIKNDSASERILKTDVDNAAKGILWSGIRKYLS